MISGISAHAYTVCTRPSPQLWEAGPGDEAISRPYSAFNLEEPLFVVLLTIILFITKL